MERPTKTIKTKKSGITAVLRTELLRGERRAIDRAAYANIDMNSLDTSSTKAAEASMKKMKMNMGGFLSDQEDAVIRNVVETTDGDPNVLERYNNLFDEDAEEIYQAANEIAGTADVDKKK